jgi:hypothetical protein
MKSTGIEAAGGASPPTELRATMEWSHPPHNGVFAHAYTGAGVQVPRSPEQKPFTQNPQSQVASLVQASEVHPWLYLSAGVMQRVFSGQANP